MTVPWDVLRDSISLIDRLADLDDPAGYADAVLPGLAELVGADVITYNDIGPTADAVRYADHPAGALDPATQAAFVRHVAEHPLVNHYRTTGDGDALRISDFLGRADFHRLALYSEFFRGAGTEHQLAITLTTPDTHVIGIALSRARTEFSDTDRDLLALLRAPLVAGLLRAGRRHRSRTAMTTGGDARLATLTDREVRILELVALGRTNTAIGHVLEISPRTVAKHLEHVFRKLEVTNRAAAVAAAVHS